MWIRKELYSIRFLSWFLGTPFNDSMGVKSTKIVSKRIANTCLCHWRRKTPTSNPLSLSTVSVFLKKEFINILWRSQGHFSVDSCPQALKWCNEQAMPPSSTHVFLMTEFLTSRSETSMIPFKQLQSLSLLLISLSLSFSLDLLWS
jgi:hypothetical protein